MTSLKVYGQNDCNKLKVNFTSYSEAINTINITKFKVAESVNTSRSTWVRGTSFYSCDKISSYFIIKTDNGSYNYKNLSISVWISFKNARSFGSYYVQNILYKYI